MAGKHGRFSKFDNWLVGWKYIRPACEDTKKKNPDWRKFTVICVEHTILTQRWEYGDKYSDQKYLIPYGMREKTIQNYSADLCKVFPIIPNV